MKSTVIIISLIIIIISYYKYNRQIVINHSRIFNVLKILDTIKLNNIINNRYLLWCDGKKDIPQFFKDYDCKLYEKIPEIIEKDKLIYIPESFCINYPMYFETIVEEKVENEEDKNKKNKKDKKTEPDYYFPTRNSIIIPKNNVKWIGNRLNQIVIGERIKLNDKFIGN